MRSSRHIYGKLGGAHPARIRALSPAAWFQPGVGVTTSLWPDQSGNSRDMTLYNTPTVNADGSVTFNGTNQYGKTAAFTLNQPTTIYLVVKQISWTEPEYLLDGNTTNSGVVYQATATPRVQLYAGAAACANDGLAIAAKGILAVVFNGANSLTQVNATAAVTGDAGASNMGAITLGCRGDTTDLFSNIQAYELLAFPAAHSAAERSVVRSYLASRHGIAL